MIASLGASFLDTQPPTNSFGQRTVAIIYAHYTSQKIFSLLFIW
jgi:hypothetical protein